jgi:hypothetical protein
MKPWIQAPVPPKKSSPFFFSSTNNFFFLVREVLRQGLTMQPGRPQLGDPPTSAFWLQVCTTMSRKLSVLKKLFLRIFQFLNVKYLKRQSTVFMDYLLAKLNKVVIKGKPWCFLSTSLKFLFPFSFWQYQVLNSGTPVPTGTLSLEPYPSQFCFGYFWDRVSLYAGSALSSWAWEARTTARSHWLRQGLVNVLHRLASNVNLWLLSS